MKISLKWINDFIDVKDFFRRPQDLANHLTRAGLEVEEVQDQAKSFQNLVIGLILEKTQHPNADKLSVCRVTTGEGVVHQIVCGAKNHQADDRVVVALPGAILPGDFVIKQSQIRGVDSAGMLCSLKELGLALESDGILILPKDAPVGKSFSDYQGLDDVVFELKVTPNRADCLSHYGLAREISCLLDRPLKKPEILKFSAKGENPMQVLLKDSLQCPRYMGQSISQVKVSDSPLWLKQRLESVGLKSINNLVDIGNYVMMELGQPLHIFDRKKIGGTFLEVSVAGPGKKFESFDGSIMQMKGDELCIQNSQQIFCLAGIVGGNHSGVSADTTEIFIECAYFLPSSVRKTARFHGLNTDSSYRFSRGVDPDFCPRALNRACQLVLELAGGTVLGEGVDIYPNPIKRSEINVSLSTISQRLGYEAEEKKFLKFIQGAGCELITLEPHKFRVKVPSFRFDLDHEIDLVEEYARLNGYEHIPESLNLPQVIPSRHDEEFLLQQRAQDIISGLGFYECVNFVFTNHKEEKKFRGGLRGLVSAGLKLSENYVEIKNPLSEDLNVMRSQLSFGLYKNVCSNFHYGNLEGKLFELGPVFRQESPKQYLQNTHLGIALWGEKSELWEKHQCPQVLSLKENINSFLRKLGILNFRWMTPQDRGEVPSFLHRGQFAQLVIQDTKIGILGSVHPVLLEESKIRVPLALSELDFSALLKFIPKKINFHSLSRQPAVERDLSFVLPNSLSAGFILEFLTAIDLSKFAQGLVVEQARIVDIFEGLGPGRRSVTYRYQLRARENLKDSSLEELQEHLVRSISEKFQIQLR